MISKTPLQESKAQFIKTQEATVPLDLDILSVGTSTRILLAQLYTLLGPKLKFCLTTSL